VITPLLVALAIAYILNPAVTWLERRVTWPRLYLVIGAFAVLAVVVLVGGVYLVGLTVAQVQLLTERLPGYQDQLETWLVEVQSHAAAAETPALATSTAPTTAPATLPAGTLLLTNLDFKWSTAWQWAETHGWTTFRTTVGWLGGFFSTALGVATLLVLIPLYTYFFLWRFNDIVATIRDYLPAAYRPSIVHVVRTIDAAVANFFRGRFLVCLCIGALTGIGWTLVGVGPGLLLGALAGALNLVPFMSILALAPALLFAYLGAADAGISWVWPVVLAMGVYLVVQAIESFLLSPMIEGQSSGLHPLTIVIALLIGAELAGLLGMLLAIPVASTLKTLAGELVLPELQRLARAPAEPVAPPPAAEPPETPAPDGPEQPNEPEQPKPGG
jgi:predicted PurR-regulated permease PerM